MASDISMNGRKKIQSIQKEFTEKFTHLTIVFFDENNTELDNSKTLSDVRKKKEMIFPLLLLLRLIP